MKKFTQLATAAALLGVLVAPNFAGAQTNDHVALKGSTVHALHSAKLIGKLPGNTELNVVVGLKTQNQAQLDQLLQDLYNPASPKYQQWLTPEQYAAQFAPTQEQVDSVVSYLKSSGLQVTDVAKNRMLISVKAKAADLEQAFGVELNNYNLNGTTYFANAADVVLPGTLAGTVNAVLGINSFEELHSQAKPAGGTVSATAPSGFSPQQISKAYNIDPIYSAGVNGAGQTLAIATAYTFKQSDIDTFSATYGIPSVTPTVIPVGRSSKRLDTETTLDLERSHALAPGANIMMYETPDALLTSFTTMFNQIATDNLAKTVSVSWGLAESSTTPSTMTQDHQIFQQMAAQGQSMYAASGDDGANDGTTAKTPDYPSSDSYVVATGGTTLQLDASGNRSAETAWSGAGGGTSAVFAAPTWQSGNLGYALNGFTNDGMRHSADISMAADPQTGYSVLYNGSWAVYGGTSFVAPEMNGFTALINQGRANGGKVSIGNMGQQIWNLGASNSTGNYYYDVNVGNNNGYNAGSGFDAPTGFGALNGFNFYNASK